MKKLIIAKRCSQALFLILFVILPAGMIFKIDPLVMAVSSISGRVLLPGLITASIMILLTLVLGRFFCWWVCPLGTIIDCAGAIPVKRRVFSDSSAKKISSIRFFILGFIIIAAIFGVREWEFDPLVILVSFTSSITALLLLVFAAFSALALPRLWCRIVCPLGAIYSAIARLRNRF